MWTLKTCRWLSVLIGLLLFVDSSAESKSRFALFPDSFDLAKGDLHKLEFVIVDPSASARSRFLILADPDENNVIYVLRNGKKKGDSLVWNSMDFLLKECFCGRNYLMVAYGDSMIPHKEHATVSYSKNPCPILTRELREMIVDVTGPQVEYQSPWLVPDKVADSTVAWVRTGWTDLPTYPCDKCETVTHGIVQNMRIIRRIRSVARKPSNSMSISLERIKDKKIRIRYSVGEYGGIHLIAASPDGAMDATIVTIADSSKSGSGVMDIPLSWIDGYFPANSSLGLIAIHGKVVSNSIWIGSNRFRR